jgi:hypothetical protein
MCGSEVPKGRRTFCGTDCVHQYRLRNQSRYASGFLYRRDRGKCALCGIDTYKKRREFWSEWNACKNRECKEKIEERYIKEGWAPLYGRRWYDADHVLPVAEGGGPRDWPLDKDYGQNLRTLCHPCHKEETKKLMERLKKKKKNGKQDR